MAKQKEKRFLDSKSWEQFKNEYEISDDRSCALLCAAYLDNCLEILVLAALVHKDEARKGLFAEMGPLGTFSAKTKIAYCLNLIPESVYKDLNAIRKIRNIYAHQLHGLSFSAEPILSECNKLILPDDYLTSMDYAIDETVGREPRQKFIFTAAMITFFITDTYHEIAEKTHQALLAAQPDFD